MNHIILTPSVSGAKSSPKDMNVRMAVVISYVISFLIIGGLVWWLGYVIPNVFFIHGYPRIAANPGPNLFYSERYNAQWFFVYLTIFNILPVFFLSIALLDQRNFIITYAYRVVSVIILVLDVIILFALLGIWIFNCNGPGSGASICSDKRWCCVYWPDNPICPKTSDCLKQSGTLGVWEASDLRVDPMYKINAYFSLGFFVLTLVQLAVSYKALRTMGIWSLSFSNKID